jgi:FlaA1/EpsC-like NDP-sugar epimerase
VENGGVALRLGNVLGSEGSVAEVFLRQMAAGLPLTFTNPRAERYFLTSDEAVGLLLSAAVEARPGCVLAPRLTGMHSVAELAEFLRSQVPEAQPGVVEVTGLRDGEKLCETLWSTQERVQVLAANSTLDAWEDLAESQPASRATLGLQMQTLKTTVRERDLAGAMAVVQRLVPGYVPSATVRMQMQKPLSGAARR